MVRFLPLHPASPDGPPGHPWLDPRPLDKPGVTAALLLAASDAKQGKLVGREARRWLEGVMRRVLFARFACSYSYSCRLLQPHLCRSLPIVSDCEPHLPATADCCNSSPPPPPPPPHTHTHFPLVSLPISPSSFQIVSLHSETADHYCRLLPPSFTSRFSVVTDCAPGECCSLPLLSFSSHVCVISKCEPAIWSAAAAGCCSLLPLPALPPSPLTSYLYTSLQIVRLQLAANAKCCSHPLPS